jgi:quinol---cytochrome c reductase iron-sulfur subunit
VRRLWRWLVALSTLLVRRRREPEEERIVPAAAPNRGAEAAVATLLLAGALFAVAFVVVYAFDDLEDQTQLLGLALGLCFACVAAALIAIGKLLVPEEEVEEDYPEPEHPEEQEQIARLVRESGGGITRKRLLLAAGGAAATAMGAAAITPALSFGPWLDTDSLYETPWRRGLRLVDADGVPWRADAIDSGTFYSAFPEGVSKDKVGSPLVLVRLYPGRLRLPRGRRDWAPDGILAFSKICTHAGCAISLYRNPLFPANAPRPALVCPCHYSTFDPATGGGVIFGPAGRPLPQLPLEIDALGHLRAGGNFSGPVGPSWQGVRGRGPS